MANQTPILIPHKATYYGFGIQSAQGVARTQPDVLLPIPDGASPKWKRPKNIMQYNDGNYERTNYWVEGESGDLSWTMPWVPGMFACAAAPEYDGGWGIAQWCWGRDSEPDLTHYAQGFYATLFAWYGAGLGLAYPDAKCTGGSIKLVGNQLVNVDIKAASITTPRAWTPEASIDHFSLNPFIHKETFLNIAIPVAGADDPWVTVKEINFDWDNQTASAADMMTVGSSGVPLGLPESARPQWKGQLQRHFSVDGEAYAAAAFWNAFMADTECKFVASLIRPTYCTATLTFPRVVIMDDDIPLPKDGFVGETVPFECLGGTDGAAAFSMTEDLGAYGS